MWLRYRANQAVITKMDKSNHRESKNSNIKSIKEMSDFKLFTQSKVPKHIKSPIR